MMAKGNLVSWSRKRTLEIKTQIKYEPKVIIICQYWFVHVTGFHKEAKKIKQLSWIRFLNFESKVSSKEWINWTFARICHLKQITLRYCLEISIKGQHQKFLCGHKDTNSICHPSSWILVKSWQAPWWWWSNKMQTKRTEEPMALSHTHGKLTFREKVVRTEMQGQCPRHCTSVLGHRCRILRITLEDVPRYSIF